MSVCTLLGTFSTYPTQARHLFRKKIPRGSRKKILLRLPRFRLPIVDDQCCSYSIKVLIFPIYLRLSHTMSTLKKCSCSWPECAWMSEQIDLFADDKHPWRGEYVTWRQRDLCSKTICQKMLFLASACKHVVGVADAYKKPGKKGYIYKKEISLAPHHFPVAIHEHKTTHKFKQGVLVTVKHNMTNFENDFAMRNIAAKEGLDRVKEDCNCVE